MKKLVLLLMLTACGDSTVDITGPTIPGPIDIVPDEDPFVQGPMLDMNNLLGFSAFRMSETPTSQQVQDMRFAQRRGYTFMRICAETVHWGGALPQGSPLNEALPLLEDTLNLAAEEGMYALVVPVCTIRDVGNGPERKQWVQKVARILEGRQNVFAEAVNEPWHPQSKVSAAELDSLIRILQRKGVLTGADQGVHIRNGKYRYTLTRLSSFPSLHPFRNPDPTRSQLQQMVDQNNGWILLSETTALGTTADVSVFGASLVTSDKEQISRYKNICTSISGCQLVVHTIEGLTGERLTWLP